MSRPDEVVKTEINSRLNAVGKDRLWLAKAMQVSISTLNQWLAPKGYLPADRLISIRLLLEKEEHPVRIGDPEGNLIAFTIEEFERIEQTRQRLHYETRPALYRDAILAYLDTEAPIGESPQRKGGSENNEV